MALMSRRHDLLAYWFSRGAIDRTQLGAARRFERLFAKAELAGHAAIDLQRPKVDGRSARHGDGDAVVVARAELLALRQILGVFDFALIVRVIGSGKDLAEDVASDAERRYLAHRIRDALGIMAAQFTQDVEVTS